MLRDLRFILFTTLAKEIKLVKRRRRRRNKREINKNLNIHVSFPEISYFIELMNDDGNCISGCWVNKETRWWKKPNDREIFRCAKWLNCRYLRYRWLVIANGTIQESLANFARRNSRPAREPDECKMQESRNGRTCGISRKNENYKLSQCAIDVSNARTCTIHKRYCN